MTIRKALTKAFEQFKAPQLEYNGSLYAAAQDGNLDAAKKIAAASINPHNDYLCMMQACAYEGNTAALRILVQIKELTTPYIMQETYSHAATAGRTETLDFLLTSGPKADTKMLNTLLMETITGIQAEEKLLPVAQILVKHGADVRDLSLSRELKRISMMRARMEMERHEKSLKRIDAVQTMLRLPKAPSDSPLKP